MNKLNAPIIFYDSNCGFCNFWVIWVLETDLNRTFLFAPLGGKKSKELLPITLNKTPFNTIVLYEQNNYFTKSEAVLGIIKKLPNYWKLLYAFKIIPTFIRNGVYDLVSLNRERIAINHHCINPSAEEQTRFLH